MCVAYKLLLIHGMTHLLTFTLPDGTRASIVPTHGLRDLTVKQLGIECLTPAQDVSVVFHVSNKQALDRVMVRFGLAKC